MFKEVFVVKKVFVVLSVLLVGLMFVSFAQQITLTFAYFTDGPDLPVIQSLIAQYQQLHPDIKINLLNIPYSDYAQKLSTMIQGGTPPDIARAGDIIPYQDVALNIAPYIPSYTGESVDEWVKNHSGFTSMEYWYDTRNEVLGIPWDAGAHALFYNKDEFEKAGITAPSTTPWTLDQWESAMEKIVNSGAAKYALTYEKTSYRWSNLLYQAGGEIWNKDGQCVINNENGVRALSFFVSLFRKNFIPESVWIGNTPAFSYFQNGLAAMFYSGTWMIPELMQKGTVNFNWGVMPLPMDKVNAVMTGPKVILGFKSTKYPKQVADFMLWLTSRPILTQWCQQLGAIPANHNLLEEGIDYGNPNLNSVMKIILTDLNNGTQIQGNWPANFERDWIVGDTAVITQTYYPRLVQDIVNAISGTMTPQQALNDVAKYFNEQMANLKASSK